MRVYAYTCVRSSSFRVSNLAVDLLNDGGGDRTGSIGDFPASEDDLEDIHDTRSEAVIKLVPRHVGDLDFEELAAFWDPRRIDRHILEEALANGVQLGLDAHVLHIHPRPIENRDDIEKEPHVLGWNETTQLRGSSGRCRYHSTSCTRGYRMC